MRLVQLAKSGLVDRIYEEWFPGGNSGSECAGSRSSGACLAVSQFWACMAKSSVLRSGSIGVDGLVTN